MTYTYEPNGVCSRKIQFDIENGKVKNVSFEAGCNGNLRAISKLVEGQDAKAVIEILSGVECGYKGTSCADQFARALTKCMKDA